MAKQNGIVNIKGKDYKTVALRVSEFRKQYPINDGWCLTTELIECSAEQVIVKATVSDATGREVATGHAQEVWKGNINLTSAVENCETSAIGRCLAAVSGDFAGSEFASANEVQQAISQQAKGHTNRPKPSQTPKMAPKRAPEADPDHLVTRATNAYKACGKDADAYLVAVDKIGNSRAHFDSNDRYRRAVMSFSEVAAENMLSANDLIRITEAAECFIGQLTTQEAASNVF